MKIEPSMLKKPAVWITLLAGSILSVIALIILHLMGYSIGDLYHLLKDFSYKIVDYISEYPILVYLSVFLVGALPLPVSPFLILAGVLFTNMYGLPLAVVICCSAIFASEVFTYFISAYPLRNLCEKIILKFADQFPEIPEEHKSKVTFIIRITPGIPFFIQNYFLGVSRVPFVKYVLISFCISTLYTTGFVVGGGAIFEGKAGLAIMAVSLIVVMGIVFKWIYSRSKSNKTPIAQKA